MEECQPQMKFPAGLSADLFDVSKIFKTPPIGEVSGSFPAVFDGLKKYVLFPRTPFTVLRSWLRGKQDIAAIGSDNEKALKTLQARDNPPGANGHFFTVQGKQN